MAKKITLEYAEKCRQHAQRKYEEEKERFALQLLAMVFYKIRSGLNEEGLEKVLCIDDKRKDPGFDKDFSEKTWKILEEVWGSALDQLMLDISKLYGLSNNQDFNFEIPFDEDDPKLDFFA